MLALPDDLESRLAWQEAHPDDIPAARKALESALVFQLKTLAQGLLAYRLLRGHSVSLWNWWHQYLCTLDAVDNRYPTLDAAEFLAFRRRFAQEIALRRVRPLTLAELHEATVRVYGGYARAWEEGRINRQLVTLGSSFRFLNVGAALGRVNRIQHLLGKRRAPLAEGRFLFGRVGPVTAVGKAVVFDFEREFAVSPLLPGRAEAFQDQARVVVRRTILRIEIEKETHKGSRAGLTRTEERLRSRRHLCLIHELQHVSDCDLFGISGGPFPGGMSTWQAAIRQDLCRFAQTPRSLEEFRSAFDEELRDLLAAFVEPWSRLLPKELASAIREKPYSVEEEVEAMLHEGILVVEGAGKVYCPLFERGRIWRLI